MRFVSTVVVSAVWLAVATLVQSKAPTVTSRTFAHRPADLYFFDDSNTIVTIEREPGIVHQSTDAGVTWAEPADLDRGEPYAIYRTKHHGDMMIIVGRTRHHWITYDQGRNWRRFSSPVHPSLLGPMAVHATDPKKILFHALEQCYGCPGDTYVTTDGFATDMQPLVADRIFCTWAKETPEFEPVNENRVMCGVKGRFSDRLTDSRLVYSDDLFKTVHDGLFVDDGRQVYGVVDMAVVKRFVVAVAKSEGTDEVALYVSTDAADWHRGHFAGSKLEKGAYTLLESTNYTLQVDVLSGRSGSSGSLYSSDSEGRHFTANLAHTNRDELGFVDFERLTGGIQGIVIVNTVANWADIDAGRTFDKDIVSKISFDDGRTFHDLRADGKQLHLHSATNQRNSGRVFSSPAPGIVMGVGNTGKTLKPYQSGDLWVSHDAGLTWRKALDQAHKYEIGDSGAVLVAVYDEGPTNQILYSLDYGATWEAHRLDADVRALELTTVLDSTSLKFILSATVGGGSKLEHRIYSIDFGSLDLRKCGDSDFEKWYTRVDKDGKPTCLMGHRQWFRRRKANVKCTIGLNFRDPVPESEPCECTARDFECDYGFMANDDSTACKPVIAIKPPSGTCAKSNDHFDAPSGWRLIPGNDCIHNRLFRDKTAPVQRPCKDTQPVAEPGKILATAKTMPGRAFQEYYYLERKQSTDGEDETIVMLTNERVLYLSSDHGKTWTRPIDDEVAAIYPHPYFADSVFFVTPSSKVYYSHSRCRPGTIHSFVAPGRPTSDRVAALGFHPTQRDWLLWTGAECDGQKDCHTTVYVSRVGGREWKPLAGFVRRCQFMYVDKYRPEEKLVYCEQRIEEDREKPFQLVSSNDWFEHKTVLFDDIIGFAVMADSEFVAVASREKDKVSLRLDASIDGKVFARARFPPNYKVDLQQAYTVLDSSTHSIFIHVTENGLRGQEYGAILKSNSNGTAYVLSVRDVNRNSAGYVDFEKTSLQGVSIVNVVANKEQVNEGARKRLRTVISHNDGADWAILMGPDGKALHLHGYTERRDPSDTFSSESGIGLLVGIGNEGGELTSKSDSSTYISRDGGISWLLARPGPHMWEFGDQGSIIVLIPEDSATKSLFFSIDDGSSWRQFDFSDSPVVVTDITTLPTDTSRQFLIWAKADGGKLVAINIDFSALHPRACKLTKDRLDGPDSDYYLWTPQHPLQRDDCLFGHVAQYIRKRPDADCFNGPIVPVLHDLGRNCSCTRRDFECDYNFERQTDGSCALVAGLPKIDPVQVCRDDPDLIEYFDVTGYRRIPLSTCHGGLELDEASPSHPCPGHETEHEARYRLSWFGLAAIFIIPCLLSAAVVYLLLKFGVIDEGAIRLPLTRTANTAGRMGQQHGRLTTGIIAGMAVVIAVIGAVPTVIRSLGQNAIAFFRRLSGSSNQSFSFRSGESNSQVIYEPIDSDEDDGEIVPNHP